MNCRFSRQAARIFLFLLVYGHDMYHWSSTKSRQASTNVVCAHIWLKVLIIIFYGLNALNSHVWTLTTARLFSGSARASLHRREMLCFVYYYGRSESYQDVNKSISPINGHRHMISDAGMVRHPPFKTSNRWNLANASLRPLQWAASTQLFEVSTSFTSKPTVYEHFL